MALPLKKDHQATRAVPPSSYDETERRNGPRIYGLFPATVRGVDARGMNWEAKTILDNLSASHFCLRLNRSVEQGAELQVIARIHNAVVELNGIVTRVEPQPNQACGIAVKITSFRFL